MGTYRVEQSYEENYGAGPDYAGPYPPVPETPLKELLGHRVRSRVGISAGLLLNAKWIGAYARLGFDLLTYKTVRSSHRPCYPPPNWVRVRVDAGLPDDVETPLVTVEPTAVEGDDVTWAVCFGMPSMAPDVWRADVEQAKRQLADGQLLNVSVVGTPTESGGLDELADDFARCASWAVESGADFVEANFSCPNVCTAEGQIYNDPEVSRAVAQRIRARIGTTPLLIKAGHFTDPPLLKRFLAAIAEPADAVVLVNAIQRKVHRSDGTPAFGQFERVGILGRVIHAESVHMMRQTAEIIQTERLPLLAMGVGGISTPANAADYFTAGAQAVFLGSAPMIKPLFAIDMKRVHPEF